MTPGNLELVEIVASWTVTLPAVSAIIVLDERRLRGVERARSWPAVSRDAAIFALWNMGLHPLCVLVHFLRTRRSARGADLGLLWLSAVIGAELGAIKLVDWLAG